MSKVIRAVQKIFGTTAGTGEIGVIGSKSSGIAATSKDIKNIQSDPNYLLGFNGITSDQGTSRLPYTEDMNGLLYMTTSQIKYLFQSGIPKWDEEEDYYDEESFVFDEGILFKSLEGTDLSPNIGNKPYDNLDKWIPVSFKELTVTGNYTIGGESTINVNTGAATITLPNLNNGEKKLIRKISLTSGSIAVVLPGGHVFTDGSTSLLLTEYLDAVKIEKITGATWTKGDLIQTEKASKGLIIGDSTIADHAGQQGIDFFLKRQSDTLIGTVIVNQAVPGDTIAQQKTIYLADSDKATYDWIIVQVGLNDLDPAEASAVAIARLQDLIDTINLNKKPTAVVIISGLIYCKQRLLNIYGTVDGLVAVQKLIDIQIAILGGGFHAITGVHYRNWAHVPILSDDTQTLYDYYLDPNKDGIHPNDRGRNIIAQTWRKTLNRLGYLKNISDEIIPRAPVSGRYTPTYYTVTGATIETPLKSNWMRVGNFVQVSGSVQITITNNLAVTFEMDCPVLPNFIDNQMAGGSAVSNASQSSLAIYASTVTNRVVFSGVNLADAGTLTFLYSFGYYLED